ncbi:MAG TPA: ComEC/Rec2 family competence protein [Bacteroidia bacterium]|nr:ComEC/Rec2 family competence protein [Bacteroidia bacterium]
MKIKLSQLPFVRILIPFALGIITELSFPSHSIFFYLSILSLCIIYLWNWREKIKGAEYSLRWINGLWVGIFLFSCGYSISLLHTPDENKNFVGHICEGGRDSMVVALISIPQEKQKTIKTAGEITGVIKNGILVKTNGKALFYFHKDSIAEKLNYGDELVVYSQLNEIEAPTNPDEFNYKQFLQTRGITYECYASAYNYSLIGNNNSNALLRFANNSRKNLATLLHEKIGGNEAEVASAILLGYREDLSRQVTQSFIDSGVVHVICVAGLHVGIIFLLLSYLIVFPAKFKHGKLMSVVLILILLWLYALFTGFATPVLRATIMFSFLTIGRHFRKYTNTVNTLAASAFIMLLFDPFSIADSGFQLSYLSVLGIIVIYKTLLSIFHPENFMLKKIWELVCVSIACQVAVLPLSILYFHQFPNYFLLANILIVPLLTVVICVGILFFLTSWIPSISVAAAWLLKKCLLLMNIIVSGVAHMPFSVTKGISISTVEVLLLFLFIIFLVMFFSSRKYYALVSGLCAIVLFLSIEAVKKAIHSGQQLFTVYNIPGKSAATFISGNQSLMPFSKVDSSDIAMHIQYNWWKLGVKNTSKLNSDTNAVLLHGKAMFAKQFAQFNNSKIVFIRQNSDIAILSGKLTLNYVVISGGYDLDMNSLKNAFNFGTLIFDSSVPDYKLKKWEVECKQLNLHFYSVKLQGAFIEKC